MAKKKMNKSVSEVKSNTEKKDKKEKRKKAKKTEENEISDLKSDEPSEREEAFTPELENEGKKEEEDGEV